MKLSNFGRVAGQFINRNSTTILSSTAVVGVISTAIFASRAGYQQGVEDALYGQRNSLEGQVKEHWRLYVPAIAVGTVTVACIVAADRIGVRRTAAIASAYAITEKAFTEYQQKAHKHLGAKGAQKVRDELAEDQVKAGAGKNEVVIVGGGEQLCHDSLSGRYFRSDIESIRKGVNDLNADLNMGHYKSLNDFYANLGLTSTSFGEEVGWAEGDQMEVAFTSVLSEDGKPCLSISYVTWPKADYYRVNR